MAAQAEVPQDKEPVEAPVQTVAVPAKVQRRIARAREATVRDAPKRRLCVRFERGDTYWYLNGRNELNFQNTATNPDGSGKPSHRIRNTYNVVRPLVQAKVSTATQRTPSYQVVPSTADDPSKVSAAELSEKAARYGYSQWGVGKARREAAYNAIGGGGEGFAIPYFDPNVGPYSLLDGPDGPQVVGQGEIKVMVATGNEVSWEPGTAFDESPYWVVELAVPIDDIKDHPDYLGGELRPDATTSDVPNDKRPSDQMVMRTWYFERPCPNYPTGRLLTIANNRVVLKPDVYPLKDTNGDPIDAPCIHRLAWDVGDGSERDFGLTWQLIDSQRTIQDCVNKIVEWKNRALLPQMLARVGTLKNRRTDEPGAVNWFEGAAEDKPEWENVPEIPASLFRVIDSVMQMMRLIASDDAAETQADLTNVAAKTIQQVIEQSLNRWDAFRAHMAEWDSKIMHHCLLLCARHYTEPRLLKIKGRDGWERVPDFQGAQLLGEVDVRVFPDSLVPQTRQGTMDQLSWINQNFPGWLNPQDALASIQEASIDRLVESYYLDRANANKVVQAIRDGTVMELPSRTTVDPLTGQPPTDPTTGETMPVPGYMPIDGDNVQVWKKVFSDWMKTDDFARQPEPAQEIARQVWGGIKALEQQQALQQAALQAQMAQGLGMANAAAPQGAKPMPSLPGSGQTPGPS